MSKLAETLASYRLAGGMFSPATVLEQLIHATETENLEGFIQWCLACERGEEIREKASYKTAELMIELEKIQNRLREGL